MFVILDTETTGFPRDWRAPVSDVNNWPRIVQLAWVLCDEQGNEHRRSSKIVRPEGFTIPLAAARIHGITMERAESEGFPLLDVLGEFCAVLDVGGMVTLVAHNIEYDAKVLGAELIRAGIKSRFTTLPKICTMKKATDYCNLPNRKYPKLDELHHVLFDIGFTGAHRASSDVDACARCFFELRRRGIA